MNAIRPSQPPDRPAPLGAVLAVTFLGSVSGGVFWAAIFFVTRSHYGFSPARNLVLATLMGACYVGAARAAGPLTRRASGRLTPRAVLAAALAAWTAGALVPLAAPGVEALLWAGALLGAAASAVTWPVVESYLAAGRHGADMRAAIGRFNVTWTPAVAVALLLLPLVGRTSALGTLALSAAGSVAALAAVAALPARPGHHAADAAQAAAGREYTFLARSTAWLLPMSYVLASALAPVLPHRLAAVGGARDREGVIAALWMLSRFVVLAGMTRTHFWHGRWETLAAATAAVGGGFALALLGGSLAALAAGLLLFGAGMALTYYAALYYSMTVGHAAVDAGGNFEALIGLGYVIGPVLGIAGHAATSTPASASSATVALAWGAMAVACAGAARPYFEARRRRG